MSRRATGGLLQDGAAPQRRAVRLTQNQLVAIMWRPPVTPRQSSSILASRYSRRRTLRAVVAAAFATVLVAGPTLAATPSISISSVGGQPVKGGSVREPLSGTVAVNGTSTASGGGSSSPAQPLVADAGDSGFVKFGQPAYLVGAGFGGAEPYTFAWSASAGRIRGADAPTAAFDTADLAEGTYTISLRVTDAAGASATDSVKVRVYDPQPRVIHDETQVDVGVGTGAILGAGGNEMRFTFDVPAGLTRFDAQATWTTIPNDYDMTIYDPAGVERGSDGDIPSEPEDVSVGSPQAGTWTAVLLKYATAPSDVRLVVTSPAASDPRPVVDTAGPFRFVTGATQTLSATVSGGSTPVAVGWDTNFDGVVDATGTSATTSLPEGRHLVTFKATDAAGFERRETTTVLVGTAERLATITPAITVIGVADSGINPYHLEFSATTYPDPDVLALTDNFTRHPSEYIRGYPADAPAIPISLGEGYYPEADRSVWSSLELGTLYWIPGTKIIGAYDAGDGSAVNAAPDATRILDDDGHGTGSSSVSTGNRYGYCPTCLLMFVESLDESINAQYPWVDIASHSFGTVGGVPVGLVFGADQATKAAAERGQTVLFAAGNGVGNAFDVPQVTYGSQNTGNDWTITVGAIRRDNNRAIVGDGVPVEISAWGDGNLPSACRTGTVGQCAFGGTSAATPYTAGIFGTVLTRVRQAIGDPTAGQRTGQVVARGTAIAGSIFLADGELTRSELREAVLKTAFPLNQANEPSTFPYPLTAPYITAETNVLFEGYGAATPEGADRAVDVILGRALVPDRSFEDQFMAASRAVKDTLYGGYDRDGDGDEDFEGLAGTSLAAADATTLDYALYALGLATDKLNGAVDAPEYALGENAHTYYLHRRFTAEPDKPVSCNADDNESYMDTANTSGDLECFENRVTSVPAAYRPVGIYAASLNLDAPIPAGSDVYATIYMTSSGPTVGRVTGTLVATDREIGTGMSELQPMLGFGTGPGSSVQGVPLPDGGACEAAGELCWTKFDLSFETTRPAFTGEHLTFQIALQGVREFAFGHEGLHASKVAIVAAPMPPTGLEFGATVDSPAAGSRLDPGSTVIAGGRVSFPDLGSDPTGAGDHPTEQAVEVSIDDPSFGSPQQATLDADAGTWSLAIDGLGNGQHTVYARARIDTTYSAVASSAFRVAPDARVEWQIVGKNAAPSPTGWQTADGVSSWSFQFATGSYGSGSWTIVVRLVEDGLEVARSTAAVKLK